MFAATILMKNPAPLGNANMNKILPLTVALLTAIVAATILNALIAIPVMVLWNYLLSTPESIIGHQLPPLDFWRAWGLLVLSGVLVKSATATVATK